MKRAKASLTIFVAALLALISLAPFCYVLLRGFWYDGAVSFQAAYQVYVAGPEYLVRFWKSLGICAAILIGQSAVSVMAGYAFAKYRFRGKKILFFLLILLMVLPLQVTLVPNYLMLDNMGLLNTNWALILPAVFSPLGAFILSQSFKSVPDSVIQAAMLDGCGVPSVITRIVLPMNKSGLVCVVLLSLLDSWNMVEQPITYLRDFQRYPFSVALSYAAPSEPAVQYVCCFLALLPPLLLFFCFNNELVEGITLAEVK